MERETMEFDVVVGGGVWPVSGHQTQAACRRGRPQHRGLSDRKGQRGVGAHILSGAVLEPRHSMS